MIDELAYQITKWGKLPADKNDGNQLLHSFDQLSPSVNSQEVFKRVGKRCLAATLLASLLKWVLKNNLRFIKEIARHRNADKMCLAYDAESASMLYCINTILTRTHRVVPR